MTAVLRRGKLCDTAWVALLLVLFTVVQFALLYTSESRRFVSDKLQLAYAATLALSWPPLLAGAAPLAFYFRLDRGADKHYCSTVSSRQLAHVMAATAAVALGCALLVLGEVLWLVEIVRQPGNFPLIGGVAIVVLVLMLWITWTVVQVFAEARAVRAALMSGAAAGGAVSEEDGFQ